jgi:hypothetical protein
MDITGVNFLFSGAGLAAAATTVEQLLTLALFNGNTGLVTSGNSFTIPAGKIFRISNIILGSRGNVTATAQVTTFSLRVNPAGAVVVGSTPIFSFRTMTPPTSDALDRATIIGADDIEIIGNGTLQIGLTANSVYVTNPPTLDALIAGFLYGS